MATLSKYAVLSILNYLDRALAETRKSDGPALECHASWNLRMAREQLLDAAITDIEVELELAA
jgi:hypothetical protein